MHIQGWFPLELTGLISLQSKGLSRVVSNTRAQKDEVFKTQFPHGPTLISIHDYQKDHSFDYRNFVGKVMSLLFNMLFRLVIYLLPRSKHLLISWLQSPSAVTLEPSPKNSVIVSIVSWSICHEVMGPDAVIFIFWKLSFKPTFSLFSFIKSLLSYSLLSAIRVVPCAYLSLLIFLPSTLIAACASFSLEFRMMYSAYKLNKQGDK